MKRDRIVYENAPTMKKMPILVIVPHGGTIIPEELEDYPRVAKFDIFYESDACANQIFDFNEEVLGCLHASVSRLFVDLDRSFADVPPSLADGVIKKTTSRGKQIFEGDDFPDDIAISALIRRYHLPFYDAIKKVLATGEVRFVIECHTMMSVGGLFSEDAGKPRPLISVQNIMNNAKGMIETAPMQMAEEFLRILSREFRREEDTVVERFTLNAPMFKGNLLKTFGTGNVPMMRLSLSRALYFTEEYLNLNEMKVDERRIHDLRQRVSRALQLFLKRFF